MSIARFLGVHYTLLCVVVSFKRNSTSSLSFCAALVSAALCHSPCMPPPTAEADGLRSRELVRQLRKKRIIELMEYTKNAEPGRFGELMCLLTPLFEVSLEVTEQLRLEQFVYEGEARIDALLLMSMINDAGNIDVSVDSVS